jgi:D-alanyl-lipoteichoic acid acyltransferase DltB (MBOAT superfamily)
MVFNSFEFILFFGVVYGLYRLLPHKNQNYILLAASYFFYGSWDWRFLFLLFFTTVVDFVCARKISATQDPKARKRWLWLSLGVNLCVLGFFKYFNFFVGSLADIVKVLGITLNPLVLKVILPVGVSFYTFQSIGYIVDVYRRNVTAEKDFWKYALFVAFFPQLVAGPIERARHMLNQFNLPREITHQKNVEGVWFVLWGFFLKVFVADNMAKLVLVVFNQKGQIPGVEVLLGSYAFAFQIFGDFAGYSFIAMGIARLLGFDLMTNFLLPYFVTNPRDFWRNWHISLSSWLKDYLYVPLGGNRNGEGQTYRNLLLTMLLGGLWHGAAWTFAIWGFYHGSLLCVHRFITSRKNAIPHQKTDAFWFRAVKIIVMFHLTCLGWLIFRAENLGQLMSMLKSLIFYFGQHSDKAGYLAKQILFYSWLAMGVQALQKYRNDLLAITKIQGVGMVALCVGMYFLFILWGEFGGHEFIYFQF